MKLNLKPGGAKGGDLLGVFPKGHQWMSLAPRFVHRHRAVTYYERYILQWVVCPVLSHAVPLLMTSVLNFPFAEMFFCWFYLVANFLSVRDSSYVIGLWPPLFFFYFNPGLGISRVFRNCWQTNQ